MSIQEYLEARKSMENATRKVEEIVGIIKHASSLLTNWKKVIIANVSGGFPMHLGLSTTTPAI